MSTVARLSFLKPEKVHLQEVERLLGELIATYARLPGFILAFHFVPYAAPPDVVGRVSIWADHHAVDHAATNSHVMALRSQVRLLLQEDSDERVVEIKGSSGQFPAPHP